MKNLLLTLLLSAILPACTPANPPPPHTISLPTAPDTTRWPLNTLDPIANTHPLILGQPRVIQDPTLGNVVTFNGTADGLILPIAPLAGMKAFTLQVLFRPESGGRPEQRFIHSEDAAGNRLTIETRLFDKNWSLDTFLLAGPSRRSLYNPAKLHPTDTWYWVALRYDGTTMSDFVNAIKELEGPVTFGPMSKEGRISLGVRLNQVDWFKGQIKELRITPRALPESELQHVPTSQTP